MQNKWLKIALLFSLGINLAAVFLLFDFKSVEPEKDFRRGSPDRERRDGPPSWIQPGREAEVDSLVKSYMAKLQIVRSQLWEKRVQLIDKLREEEPDTLQIMGLIEELAVYQTELEKITARQLLELKPNLDPEKKDIFIKIFEERMMQHRDRRRRDSDRERMPPPDSSAVNKDMSNPHKTSWQNRHLDSREERRIMDKMFGF